MDIAQLKTLAFECFKGKVVPVSVQEYLHYLEKKEQERKDIEEYAEDFTTIAIKQVFKDGYITQLIS